MGSAGGGGLQQRSLPSLCGRRRVLDKTAATKLGTRGSQAKTGNLRASAKSSPRAARRRRRHELSARPPRRGVARRVGAATLRSGAGRVEVNLSEFSAASALRCGRGAAQAPRAGTAGGGAAAAARGETGGPAGRRVSGRSGVEKWGKGEGASARE